VDCSNGWGGIVQNFAKETLKPYNILALKLPGRGLDYFNKSKNLPNHGTSLTWTG
jgi:hypothetical protein